MQLGSNSILAKLTYMVRDASYFLTYFHVISH